MSDPNRPLYSLSVKEFTDVIRPVIADELQKLLFAQKRKNAPDDDDIIFIDGVMKITGYTKSTLYTKVSRFEIPVISRKKPLTFSRQEIMNWMRDGKPSAMDNQVQDYLFKRKIA